MIHVSIIFSLLILFFLIIGAVQNSTSLQLRFIWWDAAISFPSVIFWAALAGGAIVGILSLPKLGKKSLEARRLRKELRRLAGEGHRPEPHNQKGRSGREDRKEENQPPTSR